MKLGLKKPCSNCPFRNDEGAIELAPGRLEEITQTILDDRNSFYCHKTVHYDDEHDRRDEEGGGEYVAAGDEQVCAGAMIWLLKVGRPNVVMRYNNCIEPGFFDRLMKSAHMVIEPEVKHD